MCIEQLEDRCVPAGNVAVSFFDPDPTVQGDETLYIVGDDFSNNIILAFLPLQQGNYGAQPYFTNTTFASGRWVIVFDGDGTTRATGGTQGDGTSWAATIAQDQTSVNAARIVLNLAGGSDTVQIGYFNTQQANVGGGGGQPLPAWTGVLHYATGSGDDSWIADPTILPDIVQGGGAGGGGGGGTPIPRVLAFSAGPTPNDPSATPGVQLHLGSGGDKTIRATGARFLGSLSIATGDGVDLVELIDSVQIDGDLLMELGRGNNSVRLADNITVSGALWMKGSDGDDRLELDGSNQVVTIADSLNFTAGNGANLLRILRGNIDGQLNFRGGTGEDRLLLRQSNFGIGLDILSGSGRDLVEMFRSTMGTNPADIGPVSGQLRFIKVAGDGSLKILQSVVHGDLFASLNAGNDSVVVQNSQMDGSAQLFTVGSGSDRDTVTISGSRSFSPLAIRTGGGNDFISVVGRNQFWGNMLIDAGIGDDAVALSNNAFYGKLSVTLGAGNDYATIVSNRFLGSSTVLDGGTGRDRIFQSRNQGRASLRSFP